MSDDEFTEHLGCLCPVCGEDALVAPHEWDEQSIRTVDKIRVQFACEACGATGFEVYKLAGYELDTENALRYTVPKGVMH